MKSFILNPDMGIVIEIKESLLGTHGQCPCVPSYLWNQDTICPCKKFRENDECICKLYVEA